MRNVKYNQLYVANRNVFNFSGTSWHCSRTKSCEWSTVIASVPPDSSSRRLMRVHRTLFSSAKPPGRPEARAGTGSQCNRSWIKSETRLWVVGIKLGFTSSHFAIVSRFTVFYNSGPTTDPCGSPYVTALTGTQRH